MRREIRDALEIIAWGLIGFSILIILLKWLRIIHSPELVLESLLAGLVFGFVSMKTEIREMKVKLELVWLDFKKRKKL
jgi:hypothetical protein